MRSILAITAAAMLASSAAQAAEYDCGYNFTASAYVNTATTTTATDFTPLPGLTAAIPNADTNACVIALFSAQVRAPSPGAVRVRLTLNGSSVALPASTDFYTSNPKSDERAVTFIMKLPAIGVGESTIVIDYMSVDGSEVTISKAHLQVLYRLSF